MSKDKETQGFIGVNLPKDLEEWVRAIALKEDRPISRQVVLFIKEAKEAREGGLGV